MRFHFVDRILALEPGVRITTVKSLTLGEEYLADHFPRFPVMPGVLMLQAMAEAGAWLIRVSEDFAHSLVLLKEARNVRYADFVAPGQTLIITAEIVKQDAREVQLKARGMVADRTAVNGRLVLERYNAADLEPQRRSIDEYLIRNMRQTFQMLMSAPAADAASHAASAGAQMPVPS